MKEIDRVVRDERGQNWKVGFLAWRPRNLHNGALADCVPAHL